MASNHPSALTCDQIPALVGGFVAGGLSADEALRLREHTGSCSGCQSIYRGGVETAARIGHERRLERVATEKVVRRWSLRQDAFEAQVSPRGRGARLRTLVYPAFFFYLILLLGGGGPVLPALDVEVIGGQVHASPSLVLGELCATGEDGRARISTAEAMAELGPETRLMVESIRPARVRLLEGELDLAGSWRVVTVHGLVELVGGEASIRMVDGGLECECDAGSLRIVDAQGETVVSEGEQLTLSFD